MISVSVLVPTYKRPEMLRDALHSVQAQSASNLIHEIIVSENSDDSASESIVAEFQHLPIRYIRRNPPVDAWEHFYRLVECAKSDWVALLGDDDQWARYHLEEAARLLNLAPESVASFAQYGLTFNDTRFVRGGGGLVLEALRDPNLHPWTDHVTLTTKDVFVHSLLFTPLNMWTLVALRHNLLTAMGCLLEKDKGADLDRFLIWRLSKTGPITIGKEVSLFYRRHAAASCESFLAENPEFHHRMAVEYTRRMIQELRSELKMDPGLVWHQVWADLTKTARSRILHSAMWGALEGAREVVGPEADEFLEAIKPRSQSWWKKLAKQWCPPALVRIINSVATFKGFGARLKKTNS